MFGLKRSQKKRPIPLAAYSNKVGIYTERPHMEYMVPWVAVDPDLEDGIHLVYCTDYSVFAVMKFRGPDMDSATKLELMQYNQQLNTVLKMLPTGFTLYFEAQRHLSTDYNAAEMPSPLLQQMEDERRDYYGSQAHYETEYYFTFYQAPPPFLRQKFLNAFLSEGAAKDKKKIDQQNLKIYFEYLDAFRNRVQQVATMLSHSFKDIQYLNAEETVTYLHSLVSDKRFPVKVNNQRYILEYVTDSPLLGGREPKLGKKYMKIVTILNFPAVSSPGVFDALNALNIEYRWTSRYICMSKLDAEKELNNYQQRWNQQIKGLWTQIREAITKTEMDNAINQTAVSNKDDADAALMELGHDAVAYGYYTMTVQVMDENRDRCNEKANRVLDVINSMGFTGYIESDNSLEAYRGSLPGCYLCNIRRPIVNSLNFCHLAPITAMWSGDDKNAYLKGPSLLYTDSSGYTPFRLNLHVGDIGHTMIVGPSGSGKSVLLNTLEAHFLKYPHSNVFIFDKGASSRALTLAVDGSFYNIAAEGNEDLSFQPLAHIDEDSERKWARDWLISYLLQRNAKIGPKEEGLLWDALKSLSTLSPQRRTLSNYVTMVQSMELKQALTDLTIQGTYGKLFDNNQEKTGNGRWQVYEMESLMNTPTIVPSTLSYLFHIIEKKIAKADGPSIIVLDECWLFLDNDAFRDKLREYFKVMRKQNTSIWIATQNLSDIAAKGDLLNTVNDQCLNKIYLPNINANNETNRQLYHTFGCNERQIDIIAHMTPRQDYYYCSQKGNRVFRLALRPSEAPFVTATAKTDQLQMNKIISQGQRDEFIKEWLIYKDAEAEWDKLKPLYAQEPAPAHTS